MINNPILFQRNRNISEEDGGCSDEIFSFFIAVPKKTIGGMRAP